MLVTAGNDASLFTLGTYTGTVQAGEDASCSTFWLDQIKEGRVERYVSDGDPNTVTVPEAQEDKVDEAKLNGATVRTY